ncbi:39S ribosomal protein L10, mitochondrial [Tetranychus urticae]|uniref:Large ribosomal subunit protein uL10m n=1 Tax=Tetranychus urticae TaxID=32264 RepID=T1KY46_TETUR|nr:39S ribosomal protein L10, mitochondrial [Tetranychus urticae]
MSLIAKNLVSSGPRLSGAKLNFINCGNQIRTKKKLTLRSPQFPVYEKKLLLAACEPIMRRASEIPTSMQCTNVTKLEDEEPHPYIAVLADELKDFMNKSSFIGFYHLNSCADLDYRAARNTIINSGFAVRLYQNNIADLALKSTKYDPLLKFFSRSCKTVMVFGDNLNVKPLLKIEKTAPFLILMFGVYQDRVLRKDELIEISNLPNLSTLHAQLYHTLNTFGTSLTSTLDYHGNTLSNLLTRVSDA